MKRILLTLALLLTATPGFAADDADIHDSVRSTAHSGKTPDPAQTGGITAPRAANPHIMTEYPEISRVNREEGVVTLRFTVNTDGTVSNPSVLKSSGYPRLDQAAMDQVTANWRYYPATKDGAPVAVMLAANVVWHLVQDEDSGFEYFKMTQANFPPGAREKGESGSTVLLVQVGKAGKPLHIRRMRSSGFADLDEAAEKIAQGWTFGAAEINGKPVASGIGCVFDWLGATPTP